MSIQAIFQAIKQNDLPALKLLLQANPNMLHERNKDSFQYTPLLYAAVVADFDLFEWLISQGADWQTTDIDGDNVLDLTLFCHVNTNAHQRAKLDYLLKLGATFVHEVFELIYQGDQEALSARYVINPAAFNVQDHNSNNYWHYVTALGQYELLIWGKEKLQLSVSTANKNGTTPLLCAARNGHLAVVQWLLQEGGARIEEQDSEGWTALIYAVNQGHLAVVQWLLQEGGAHIEEQDSEGWTALLHAANKGHLAVVQWLVQEGNARIEVKDNYAWTALLYAANKGHLTVVQWLLQAGYSCIKEKDEYGWTALLHAANKGHLSVVQWLLRAGGSCIKEKDKYDWTALLHAAARGHLVIVQWLLQEGGAHIEERDKEGWTALLHAAGKGHLAVVQWLLQVGNACIKEKDKDGCTALLHAAARGHLAIVQWLLQEGGARLEKTILLRANGAVKTWLKAQKAQVKRVAEQLIKGEKLLSIRLHYLDKQDAETLSQALQNINCPVGLTLNLQNALTSLNVYELLMKALESGYCPAKLSLNLANNNLGLEGAKMLRQTLLSDNTPANLDLNISHNHIGSDGYKLIQAVLADPHCPTGLRIQIDADNVTNDRYRCVIVEQGRRQLASDLSIMPPEIWDQVYGYLNPYLQSDIRYRSFPRKLVQVVAKADQESLRLRLQYFVNLFEPNVDVTLKGGMEDKILEALPSEAKTNAVSAKTTQLINDFKQLITTSIKEDIRTALQKSVDDYIAKITSKNNSEVATIEQLINYRLLSYEQVAACKNIFNKPIDDKVSNDENKQQIIPYKNERSKKRTYSTFKFFDNSLSATRSTDTDLNTHEERPTKRMTLEKQ